jgi:alpha-mannosidase
LIPLGAQGRRTGDLPPATSLCRIDASNVLLTALKRADDGKGYILRLTETEGRSAEVRIDLPRLRIARACRTNLAEKNLEPLSPVLAELKVSVTPYSITTLRVCP